MKKNTFAVFGGGAFLGGQLLGLAPSGMLLLPLQAAILLASAFKVWRHE